MRSIREIQFLHKILIKSNTVVMITRSQSKHSNNYVVNYVESVQEFHMKVNNLLAKVECNRRGDVLNMHHSFVPPELRGKGIGYILAKGTFDAVEENNLKMILTCTFLYKVYKEHEEEYKHLYADLSD